MPSSAVLPNNQARAILDRFKFITIATVSSDGEPWSTPIAPFHFPSDYTYYWISWRENQHSKNIRANGKAFVTVFDSTPPEGSEADGVYIQADAYELSDEQEVARVATALSIDLRDRNGSRQLLDADPRRLYKVVPQKIWIRVDDEVEGKPIDAREEAIA